jgi:hypothetical protein
MSEITPADSKENQQLSAAKSEQVRQNPQPGRKHDAPPGEKPESSTKDERQE